VNVDLHDLDDTVKRVHVKPDGDDWIVIKLTDLENYFDDLGRCGETVADENLRRVRMSRGFAKWRFIEWKKD